MYKENIPDHKSKRRPDKTPLQERGGLIGQTKNCTVSGRMYAQG